jgi:hypothetical protein
MKIAIQGPRLVAATTLALLFASTGLATSPPSSPTPAAADDKLQSEFLFDLVLEAQMPTKPRPMAAKCFDLPVSADYGSLTQVSEHPASQPVRRQDRTGPLSAAV